MRRDLKTMLIAMTLGDGCIVEHSPNKYDKVAHSNKFYLQISHAGQYREYVEWKRAILSFLFRDRINIRKEIRICNLDGKTYTHVHFSKQHKCLRHIYKLMYPNRKKTYTREMLNYLTPIGIAIWYMDDGSFTIVNSRVTLNIHTSEQQATVVQTYFKEKWGIEWGLAKDRNHIFLSITNLENREKLFNLIRPYVLQVPCMRYKLGKYTNPTSLSNKDDDIVRSHGNETMSAERKTYLPLPENSGECNTKTNARKSAEAYEPVG